jgi:hypothetical protein
VIYSTKVTLSDNESQREMTSRKDKETQTRDPIERLRHTNTD